MPTTEGERELLRILSDARSPLSTTDLAQLASAPFTTTRYRLRQLKHRGLIVSHNTRPPLYRISEEGRRVHAEAEAEN